MKRSFKLLLALIAALFVLSPSPASSSDLMVPATPTGFVDTYARAQPGDKLIISGNTFINDIGGGGAPLILDKAVTIEGRAGTGAYIQLRYGGIILGADVVFRRLSLSFENKIRNAIIVNDHHLTLEDVDRVGGSRPVHIFAGTYADYYGRGVTPPRSGSGSRIDFVRSTDVGGNIYLGSLNAQYSGSVVLDFTGRDGGMTSTIFSQGALETAVLTTDLFTGEVDPPTIVNGTYPTNGDVLIKLKDPHSNTSIDCRTGSASAPNARLEYTLGISSVFGLKLNSPSSLSVFHGGGDNKLGIDSSSVMAVPVELSVPTGLELQLNKLSTLPKVSRLAGGGTLALGAAQTLEITGEVSGTTTFRVEGTNPNGLATEGHTYIKAPRSSKSSFSFVPVYPQDDLMLQADGAGNWTIVRSAPPTEDTKVTSLVIYNGGRTVGSDDINAAGGIELRGTYTLNKIDPTFELAYVPFTVSVARDGGTSRNFSSAEDGDGYHEAKASEHNMKIWAMSSKETDGEAIITIEQDDPLYRIKSGRYDMKFIIRPANSGTVADITAPFTLTVSDGSIPSPSPSTEPTPSYIPGKYTDAIDRDSSDGLWNARAGGDLAIHIDVDYDQFAQTVSLDDVPLAIDTTVSHDFGARSGSTVVTIWEKTLKEHIKTDGEHTAEIGFKDGTAIHKFTVSGTGEISPQKQSTSGGACATGAAALVAIAGLVTIKRWRR